MGGHVHTHTKHEHILGQTHTDTHAHMHICSFVLATISLCQQLGNVTIGPHQCPIGCLQVPLAQYVWYHVTSPGVPITLWQCRRYFCASF